MFLIQIGIEKILNDPRLLLDTLLTYTICSITTTISQGWRNIYM